MNGRALLLGGVLVVTAAGGAVAVRQGLLPAPYVAPEPPVAKKAPIADHPPARKLSPAANAAPESVVRAALDPKSAQSVPGGIPGADDGVVTTLTVTTPIFDIEKRYRSMEGPHAEYDVRLASDPSRPRELLWWKGARIEVLDAAGKPLGQEFMCHLNVNVDQDARGAALGMRPKSTRLLTLTQGETFFTLPKGHAIPVASDEIWSLMFQVLNHNRDGVFHVRQRLTLYFVRDVDLFAPVDALDWYAGSLWVPLDKSNADALAIDDKACHCCPPLVRGLEATNNVTTGRLVDEAGRTLVGHWVVPPGPSTWSYPLARYVPTPTRDWRLYATWTHVHPFAKEVRLLSHKPGCEPRVITRSSIESIGGEGLVGLKGITSMNDREGVVVPSEGALALSVDYDNTSNRPQDSMTSLGMFVGADEWKRPEWANRAQNPTDMDASCGL